MSNSWFIVPGYGAQGGTADEVRHAFDSNGLGAVVNNSRGIIFAHERLEFKNESQRDWTAAVAAATDEMIRELRDRTPAGNL
jgi:orotidine-5'-phosphate decarboxylase